MNVTGIIAEYNPFHLGHQYHLEQARKLTNADYIIVVMSGNFTQRGTPAIMDKYSRAKQALEHGADLVLELPVCFASASAESFAFGGVSLLHKLGVVNHLVFGSEEGSVEQIQKTAYFLNHESEEYRSLLQNFLKQGYSFPKARSLSLEKCLPKLSSDFLFKPNNILGVEYCRALLHFQSKIKAITVPRIDNQYHDKILSIDGKFSSATAIRETIKKAENHLCNEALSMLQHQALQNSFSLSSLKNQVPNLVYDMIEENYGKTMPIFNNDFSSLLQYKLLLEFKKDLSVFSDISLDFADRIKNNMDYFTDFDSFCERLKTKELTYSRISRGLLHILLDLKEQDLEEYRKTGYARYGHILGFRKSSSPLLHDIKKHSEIPLISKLADSVKTLDALSLSMLEKDIQAAHIYESVVSQKYKKAFQNELRRKIIVM